MSGFGHMAPARNHGLERVAIAGAYYRSRRSFAQGGLAPPGSHWTESRSDEVRTVARIEPEFRGSWPCTGVDGVRQGRNSEVTVVSGYRSS
jgi:hypothetical protein